MSSVSLAPNDFDPSFRNPFSSILGTRNEMRMRVRRDHVQIMMTVPGFLLDDFGLSFCNNALRITAARRSFGPKPSAGGMIGVSGNFFHRIIPIDVVVDEEKIAYVYEQGILKVFLPRKHVRNRLDILREKLAIFRR